MPVILQPQAQRDTYTLPRYHPPDLGYHYDPIDYLVDNVAITNTSVSNGIGGNQWNSHCLLQ